MALTANISQGMPRLLDYYASIQKESEPTADLDETTRKQVQAAKQAQAGYAMGSISSAPAQIALKKALEELSAKHEGKITFSDIFSYRHELEEDFSAQLKKRLAEMGVKSDTDFSLTHQQGGSIQVNCTDPEVKSLVETYVNGSPQVREQFAYIHSLASLERAQQTPTAAKWNMARNTKVAFQAKSIEAFFTEAQERELNYTPLIASFQAGSPGAEFYSGLNFTV